MTTHPALDLLPLDIIQSSSSFFLSFPEEQVRQRKEIERMERDRERSMAKEMVSLAVASLNLGWSLN